MSLGCVPRLLQTRHGADAHMCCAVLWCSKHATASTQFVHIQQHISPSYQHMG